jgi:hypothetical protein
LKAHWSEVGPKEQAELLALPQAITRQLPQNLSEASADQEIRQLRAQMHRLMGQSLEVRHRHYRALCLQWHPDKNPRRVLKATVVFRALQDAKLQFLT